MIHSCSRKWELACGPEFIEELGPLIEGIEDDLDYAGMIAATAWAGDEQVVEKIAARCR